jgi:hypothetical protein
VILAVLPDLPDQSVWYIATPWLLFKSAVFRRVWWDNCCTGGEYLP